MKFIGSIFIAFILGYLIFRLLRKRANIRFLENQIGIKRVEEIHETTLALFDDILLLLDNNFEEHAQVIEREKLKWKNLPFDKLNKNGALQVKAQDLQHELQQSFNLLKIFKTDEDKLDYLKNFTKTIQII